MNNNLITIITYIPNHDDWDGYDRYALAAKTDSQFSKQDFYNKEDAISALTSDLKDNYKNTSKILNNEEHDAHAYIEVLILINGKTYFANDEIEFNAIDTNHNWNEHHLKLANEIYLTADKNALCYIREQEEIIETKRHNALLKKEQEEKKRERELYLKLKEKYE